MISIIAAIDNQRGIGKQNKLLWRIPADMKRFRKLTNGHPVIMGRKTYESIGKPLPNRVNIIVSRDNAYNVEGCIIAHSVPEAIEKAKEVDTEEVFIIGGAQIYTQALPYADKLYLTLVNSTFDADTFFPVFTSSFTKETFRETGSEGELTYTFVNLEK